MLVLLAAVSGLGMGTNVGNLWDFGFMWLNFEYFAKLAAPFVMIAVAVMAVGALLLLIVKAVKSAIAKD